MPDPRFFVPQFPVFKPAMRCILSITQAFPAVVTTSFNGTTPGAHGYETGLTVRITVPRGCGMTGLDGFLGEITKIDAFSFSIQVDTSSLDPYVIPAQPPALGAFGTVGQATPVGEVGNTIAQAVRNVLPYT